MPDTASATATFIDRGLITVCTLDGVDVLRALLWIRTARLTARRLGIEVRCTMTAKGAHRGRPEHC